ncbi:hypothetical protein HXK74_01010 [Candidatus Gracilibacteria bacterium]|nr:hypothetical protein [Candidatus Gracilibacteria bacterium]
MKIVLSGIGELGMNNLSLLLEDLGYTNLVFIDKEQYHIKSDDIVIYADMLKDSSLVKNVFSLKFSDQQPLKVWSCSDFLSEMSKYFCTISFHQKDKDLSDIAIGFFEQNMSDFGGKTYFLNEKLTADIRQIFDAILSGRKIPYYLIKKMYFLIENTQNHLSNLYFER